MSTTTLNKHLAPLAYLIGTTWTGEFAQSTPDKPMVDVMRFERALSGNGIRILHSINRGEYGGETMIMWDNESGQLVYWYFTTSGFYTRGTMVAESDHYTAHEVVTGNANGVTEVRAKSHRTPDGSMRTTSQYFKDGAWVEGHSVTYTPTPEADVVFQ